MMGDERHATLDKARAQEEAAANSRIDGTIKAPAGRCLTILGGHPNPAINGHLKTGHFR